MIKKGVFLFIALILIEFQVLSCRTAQTEHSTNETGAVAQNQNTPETSQESPTLDLANLDAIVLVSSSNGGLSLFGDLEGFASPLVSFFQKTKSKRTNPSLAQAIPGLPKNMISGKFGTVSNSAGETVDVSYIMSKSEGKIEWLQLGAQRIPVVTYDSKGVRTQNLSDLLDYYPEKEGTFRGFVGNDKEGLSAENFSPKEGYLLIQKLPNVVVVFKTQTKI